MTIHNVDKFLKGSQSLNFDEYSDLMRNLVIDTMRGKSGYIPPKFGDYDVLDTDCLWTVRMVNNFVVPSSLKNIIIHSVSLSPQFCLCFNCVWELRRHFNKGYFGCVTVHSNVVVGDTCKGCGEMMTEVHTIPF